MGAGPVISACFARSDLNHHRAANLYTDPTWTAGTARFWGLLGVLFAVFATGVVTAVVRTERSWQASPRTRPATP